MNEQSKMMVPVIVGGLVVGGASGIGIIKVFSIFCCLWFILIGCIQTWVVNRPFFDGTIEPVGITVAEGAMTGAVTGFLVGIIAVISHFIIHLLSSVRFGEMTIAYAILVIFIYPILGTIFGAIGGIIIAKIKG